MSTTTRRAACNCGQLHLTIEGEPSRISMCHCLECQRRTGAVVGNQARFRREQIAFAGTATEYTRSAASGNTLTFRFCPHCGSTVYWTGTGFPGLVAVAIGTLADPTSPPPPSRYGKHPATPGSPHPPIRRRGAWRSRADLSSRNSPQANIRDPAPLAPPLAVMPSAARARSARAGIGRDPGHLGHKGLPNSEGRSLCLSGFLTALVFLVGRFGCLFHFRRLRSQRGEAGHKHANSCHSARDA